MIGETFEFVGELDLQMVGTYRYHAIRVPATVQAEMKFVSGVKQRFKGTLNGEAFSGALMPTGTGSYYIMVNAHLRKKQNIELGDQLNISITIVDPNEVEVPEDLLIALSGSGETLFKWEVLTAGTKRGILHQIASARTAITRSARIESLINRLNNSQPYEPFALRKRL